jgi:hypothetical protein
MKLKIIQHNVRNWNVNNRFALSNVYLQEDPDIILINSHGLKQGEPLKIQNYDIHKVNKNNEDHSGAAIAMKSSIKYRLIDNFHSDMLGVTIETIAGPIHIATTYIPPRQRTLHYPDFHSILTRPDPTYILGDCNARHQALGHRDKNLRGELLATLINRGHADHIGPPFPTFLTHRSATTPDIILANKKAFLNFYSKPGTLPTPSDHKYIIFELSTSPIQIPTKERPALKKADWIKYRQELRTRPLPIPDRNTTVDLERLAVNWTENIKTASDISIPTVRYRTIPHVKTNHAIRLLQIEYSALMTDFEEHGTDYDKYRRLIELRRELQTTYKELQTESWNELIDRLDIELDSKTFWTSIKKLQGNESKLKASHLTDHQGNKIEKDQEKEAIFRRYWENVFRISEEENRTFDAANDVLVKNATDAISNQITPYELSDLNRYSEIEMPKITVAELAKITTTTKQKAPGLSGITKEHFAQVPIATIEQFITICNHCLTIGYFPEVWKHGNMIFIPKPNKSPLDHVNYRPISLLEVPGKIFEKIINKRLIAQIDKKNLNNKYQHGFRAKRGTHTALALIHETLATEIGNNKLVDLILRDISRAFDKVWHLGLKFKIHNANFPEYLCKILCSYVTNRTANIRIGEYQGPNFKIHSGVPQGGCLSPTLFNLYTHDIGEPTRGSKYFSYADDVTQIVSTPGKSLNMHALSTKRAIEAIDKFEHQWKIKTNATKFQMINIGRRRKQNLQLNNRVITYSSQGTVLGLHIKTNGYHQHVRNRKNMAIAQLIKLRRFRNLNPSNKRKLYLALVRSKLIYPTIPLHALSKNQLLEMQMVQNQAARFITGSSRRERRTNESIHQEARLQPINLTLHKQATETWKTINQIMPRDIIDYFHLNGGPNTRYRNYLPSSIKTIETEPEPLYRRT